MSSLYKSSREVWYMPPGPFFSEKKSLSTTPRGSERATQKTNLGEDRMNADIMILSLSSANGLLGGRVSGYRSWKLLVLRMGHYLWKRMNHKLANGMDMWKGNSNTITLLFSLKELEVLHQERRGKVNTIVMEHFKSILFHKSGLTSNIPINH